MGLFNRLGDTNLLGMRIIPAPLFPGGEPAIALIGHSGALLSAVSGRPGFPLACLVSVGNGAVIPLEEIVEYCAELPQVRVISVYLEGVKRPEQFCVALEKAAKKRKPVVLLKGGQNKVAAAAAIAHTGSFSDDSSVYTGICEKYGCLQVNSVESLAALSEALVTLNGVYPVRQGIAALHTSGGFNTFAADCLIRNGISFAQLSQQSLTAIQALLPPFATASNPLDTTTALLGNPERAREVLHILERDPSVGLVAAGVDIGEKHGGGGQFALAQAMLDARERGTKKPYVIYGMLEYVQNAVSREVFTRAGICLLPSAPTAAVCIKKILTFASYDPNTSVFSGVASPCYRDNGKGFPLRASVSRAIVRRHVPTLPYGKPTGVPLGTLHIRTFKDPKFGLMLGVKPTGLWAREEVLAAPLNTKEAFSLLKRTGAPKDLNPAIEKVAEIISAMGLFAWQRRRVMQRMEIDVAVTDTQHIAASSARIVLEHIVPLRLKRVFSKTRYG